MAAPIQGVGYLLAEDLLEDISYSLFEPIVALTFPASISAGTQTIPVGSAAIFVGCQLVAGYNTANMEVVTVTAATTGSFTATFANAHTAGDSIRGATFPVRQTTDPLFQQSEVIAYLSTATNDFLTDCPLCYEINESVTVGPAAQSTPLPSDCMFPARIARSDAAGMYPLRETSQANLDAYDYRWKQQVQSYSQPTVYFRDRIPVQNFGVWPRAANSVVCEVVYAQRTAPTLGLADGFPIPDPFLPIVKWRALSFAYSKDGESRQPALAKYWASRYEYGVQIAKMILEAINDPNLQMGQ